MGSSIDATKLASVSRSKDQLNFKIFDIKENGATALGPAMVVALGIASQIPHSEIIVSTDGLPNIGLGAMDNPASKKVKNFLFLDY